MKIIEPMLIKTLERHANECVGGREREREREREA
jgi:hypothetical protein